MQVSKNNRQWIQHFKIMPISTIRAIWLNTVQIHNQLQRGVIRVIIYTFCHEILLYNSFMCTFTQIRELKLFTFSTIPLIYLTIANTPKLRPKKSWEIADCVIKIQLLSFFLLLEKNLKIWIQFKQLYSDAVATIARSLSKK